MVTDEPQGQLRRAEAELTIATAKVDVKTKRVQHVQYQVQRLEGDADVAKSREHATDRLLQHLQSALGHLEARREASCQKAESFHGEAGAPWMERLVELQERCATLEGEKFEALARARESFREAEEASLQRDLAWLKESQRMDEWKKTEKAIGQLIRGAAVRTREEVEKVRGQCDAQIKSTAEEVSALRLECAEKDSQIQRALQERRAAEEELERVYREGAAEPDASEVDALHRRCLDAERTKDDMGLTLRIVQRKLEKLDLDYGEETSRCREEVRRLRDSLAASRDDCVRISEERLRMQRENLQLRKEVDELKARARQRASQMEDEHSRREQALGARVRELEERSRCSGSDLTRLLAEQHRSIQHWREEVRNLVQDFETTTRGLAGELRRQRRRSGELEMQRATDRGQMRGLLTRVTQAERRATTATQRLCALTAQGGNVSAVDPWMASVHPHAGNGLMSYIQMKANSTFNAEVRGSFQSW